MSLHDELRSAQRCVDDLARCVARLERALGRGLETRRVRSDTDHLRESLALLAATAPTDRAPEVPPVPGELTRVPEAPYDERLWAGADDEGVGTRRGP
ncbi:hypothetical protein [Streptomyces radicis]|uniref:Uncharacterized protein n=1 Tax=Streptomyces radicis TaxID=1750517 RepID=A0A3A9W8X7_9ACTN|nr:hypothetical protein [Streptomyces radicis]RKN09072.1 hypothetical protein D7319_14185 [Streptomyces radicis]RKN22737.1 hypothetical protein D7318_14370 [Streptomyces radicis]